MNRSAKTLRRHWIVAGAAALFTMACLTPASAATDLSDDAVAATSQSPLYLPAGPANPNGLKGYNHSYQMDVSIEAHDVGKNKSAMSKASKNRPNNAVVGPKVKSGSYELVPAPDVESALQ